MSARTWITAATIAVLLVPRTASALHPRVRITQYRHTAWRVQEGAFESAPNAIAQTADGYIWIGTDSGLVRFDGVRFVAGCVRRNPLDRHRHRPCQLEERPSRGARLRSHRCDPGRSAAQDL